MAAGITCLPWTVVVLLWGCGPLWAFNLDTDDVLRMDGDPGSLFGFSLAMHWQLQPVEKRMLLVGAPTAKALPKQTSTVTGGLYTCDMTSSSSGCTRVEFDNNEDPSRESKENQWMGVSVSSQGPGGKIMTCAHRYQRRNNVGKDIETRDIIGRCYVLSQSLTIDSGSQEEGDSWHFCDSRSRGHEMFGSCQQGLSATFDKDYHYLIFGAPGAYNWKGVVRLEQRNETLLEMGIWADGPFEAGDETNKDPNRVPSPANSYMGFSLDSGKQLIKQGDLIVVAGAPRANHSGAVLLLEIENTSTLDKVLILEGEGLASSFGYDLAVVDLNADGWQDIVVGAPQYFEKDGDIGGAVYVYVNKAGTFSEDERVRIDGPKDSMFGLAVENLGDINQDGYHDFAVGAPYDDDEAGAVYIYHGADKILSPMKEKQVLYGKTLGVKLFGYSLAGNMDLDRNSYPDLAVGSLSDAVFVFRARPIIDIEREINFSPKEIDFSKKNCEGGFCLEVDVCFTYTARPESYAPSLTVAYSLEVDAEKGKNGLPRATFTDPPKGTITINTKGKKQCIKRHLVIKESIRDKLRGIPIDVSVEIQGANRKRRQSSTSQMVPVLEASEPTRSEVNFKKEGCGIVCQSNLQMKYRYGRRTKGQDAFEPLQLVGGLPVIVFSEQNSLALEVTVSNTNGDPAHEAYLNASFPPSLTYSDYHPKPIDKNGGCTANQNGSLANCQLANPFKRNKEITFYILLGTLEISLNTAELEIDLQLYTTSAQGNLSLVKAKATVAFTLKLSVSGQVKPSQVYFSGEVKGESAMKTEMDIGSAVTHQFRISNLGKRLKGLGTATLDIDWPMETADGNWLLYLMKISSTGVDQMECSRKDVINPLKVAHSNRMRRAAETNQGINDGTISRLLDKKREHETLSCEQGAKCVKIKCPLQGLDSNAVITFHSRLWNNTFTEKYSKFNFLVVKAKASLHIDGGAKNTKLENEETEVKLTVFPERQAAQHGGVPWWIIVLSILFGLLLLALLAFLLWKCGVFDKKNKEDPSEKERLTNA